MDFAIPFPLSPEETQREHLTARRRTGSPAPERGKHLLESRYGCRECHSRDFSGGVMIDDLAIGRLLGPNLTGGAGGRTAGFRPADWDRIVRHGVKPGGTPGARGVRNQRLRRDGDDAGGAALAPRAEI